MQLSAVWQEKSAPGEFHQHVMRPPCENLISWGLGGLFDYGDIDVDFVEFILWLLAVV